MLNLVKAFSLLQHLIKAKTRHGVHSPFIYRLLDEVIYDFRAKKVYQEIEGLRAEFLQNERNKTFLNNNSLISPSLAQLVHRLVADLKPQNSIELGARMGICTAYLAKAASEANIISISRNFETLSITEENLQKLNIRNVELLSGNVDELLPKLLDGILKLDFILIDGNHSKISILNYFNCCLPKMSDHSMMILEDIYQNEDMKSAWQEIKSHPDVSVTIDLFWMGLVFVRRAQNKENFKIRF